MKGSYNPHIIYVTRDHIERGHRIRLTKDEIHQKRRDGRPGNFDGTEAEKDSGFISEVAVEEWLGGRFEYNVENDGLPDFSLPGTQGGFDLKTRYCPNGSPDPSWSVWVLGEHIHRDMPYLFSLYLPNHKILQIVGGIMEPDLRRNGYFRAYGSPGLPRVRNKGGTWNMFIRDLVPVGQFLESLYRANTLVG